MKVFVFSIFVILINSVISASYPVRIPSTTTNMSIGQCQIENDVKQNVSEIVRSYLYSYVDDTCSCNSSSGWVRVGYLNMSDPTQICPTPWSLSTTPTRSCGRHSSNSASCDSVFYSSNGLVYNQVCGKINGYMYGDTNGFDRSRVGKNINNWYIDGISLTYGQPSFRKHIWTFVSTHYLGGVSSGNACPCFLSNSSAWVYTVENNYFCSYASYNGSFSYDTLWDGQGCTGTNRCCQFNQPPWFCRSLPTPSDENLEVRICADQGTNNENVYISNMEIFVK